MVLIFALLAFGWLAITYLVMLAAQKFFNRLAAMAVGIASASTLIWGITSVRDHCSGEPNYIPPKPGEGGEGLVIFPCDAPLGTIINIFTDVTGPITALCSLALSVYFGFRKPAS